MWPFKPNDWIPVFVESDDYTVTSTYAGVPLKGTEHTESISHTLYYSASRNKYRIDWNGYAVTSRMACPSYIACVKKQIELQNQ